MKYFSPIARWSQHLRALGGGAAVLVGCATYDGTQTPRASDPVAESGAGGTDAGSGGALTTGAGRNQGGRAGISGDENQGGTADSDAGSSGGEADNAGAAGEAGSPSDTSGGGGGGSSGAAGGIASGGSSGGNGGAPAGGTAGAGGAADVLLSQGKASTADSTQATNVAGLGNDGSIVTRWCAANGDPNHYWQVDLAALRTLSRIDVAWEKSANYKFKIEGSSDGNTWSLLVDQRTTTSTASGQSYKLDAAPKARWVKVTVTGLPNSTTWASFYELQVFGH